MNQGVYLDKNIANGSASDFCIGVGGYSEKNFEAPNFVKDLQFLKQKVDAGADDIVTQMFFDNEKCVEFVDVSQAIEINVPIIPGLKRITRAYQLRSLPRIFHLNRPTNLTEAVQKTRTKKTVKKIGIDWCIQQSRELMERGAPCFALFHHVGDTATILEIVSKTLST